MRQILRQKFFNFLLDLGSTALMRATILLVFLALNSLWSATFFLSKLSSDDQLYLYSLLCLPHKPVEYFFISLKPFPALQRSTAKSFTLLPPSSPYPRLRHSTPAYVTLFPPTLPYSRLRHPTPAFVPLLPPTSPYSLLLFHTLTYFS